jgi:hypothetical protein
MNEWMLLCSARSGSAGEQLGKIGGNYAEHICQQTLEGYFRNNR